MQIYPISATGASATGTATAPGVKTLGQEDFLKLLSVQMQAQDPLDPMKDTEFISQMANFTSLEQMKNLNSSFDAFISQQRSVDATGYLGKTVTVLDPDAGLVTGPVSGVTFATGKPQIIVGGKPYDPAMINSIQATPTTNASPTTATNP